MILLRGQGKKGDVDVVMSRDANGYFSVRAVRGELFLTDDMIWFRNGQWMVRTDAETVRNASVNKVADYLLVMLRRAEIQLKEKRGSLSVPKRPLKEALSVQAMSDAVTVVEVMES